MASRAYSRYHADRGKSLMGKSQTTSNGSAPMLRSSAFLGMKDEPCGLDLPVSTRVRFFAVILAASLALAALLLTGCGDEPAPKPAAEEPVKPAEAAVPEDMQAAALNLLGKETQVLVFGDLAKTGKQQFLAANVVPKTPKNDIPGTIVTRAVIAEETDGKWSELLRCDEYLKNAKGYLALTPLAAVSGWKVQWDQDPVKGIQLYFTPVKTGADKHVLPIGVAWNRATKRYQSLDLAYEHFLMEKPSLDTARSVLR
jgi:hypothetical protein